jgi:guanosine-3',5'-bis(diphosphate) 3'-pyrophosphohydrolase
VEVANQRGVLANLASTIASTDSNIDDISVDAHDGRFNIIYLTVSVKDRRHLARIIRRIKAIKVVTKINRHH